ncbi:MAG: hypothetical protein IKN24_02845 [Lachnospiraceae bacterium]|nr:hypothetical protein [Lachnospiraceae bacterium]
MRRTLYILLAAALLAGCADDKKGDEQDSTASQLPLMEELRSDPALEEAYRQSLINTAVRDRIDKLVSPLATAGSAQDVEMAFMSGLPEGVHVDVQLGFKEKLYWLEDTSLYGADADGVVVSDLKKAETDYSYKGSYYLDISPMVNSNLVASALVSRQLTNDTAANEVRLERNEYYIDYNRSEKGAGYHYYFTYGDEFYVKEKNESDLVLESRSARAMPSELDTEYLSGSKIADFIINRVKLTDINEEEGYYRFEGNTDLINVPYEFLENLSKYILPSLGMGEKTATLAKELNDQKAFLQAKLVIDIGVSGELRNVSIVLSGNTAYFEEKIRTQMLGITSYQGMFISDAEGGDITIDISFGPSASCEVPENIKNSAKSYEEYQARIDEERASSSEEIERRSALNALQMITEGPEREYGLYERILNMVYRLDDIDVLREKYEDVDYYVRLAENYASLYTPCDDLSVAKSLYEKLQETDAADKEKRLYYIDGILLAMSDEDRTAEGTNLYAYALIEKLRLAEPGDTVEFGPDYTALGWGSWIVFDKTEDELKLINISVGRAVTFGDSNDWKQSPIRDRFTQGYYEFPNIEQQLIKLTPTGDTTDRVRLLSADEAREFGDIIKEGITRESVQGYGFDMWLSTPGEAEGTLMHFSYENGVVDDGLRSNRSNTCNAVPVIVIDISDSAWQPISEK